MLEDEKPGMHRNGGSLSISGPIKNKSIDFGRVDHRGTSGAGIVGGISFLLNSYV